MSPVSGAEMKLLYVIWRDCTHYSDISIDLDEVKTQELIEMHDVGFLVHESESWIALAMERVDPDKQNQVRHVTWIPKCNVVKRIVLTGNDYARRNQKQAKGGND